MIPFGPATRILLAPGPTDMRRSFDGLAEMVRQRLGEDPLSGRLFVFTNRRRNRLKILVWDGSGLWVCAKRLEEGTFRWPAPEPGHAKVRLSAEELELGLGECAWPSTAARSTSWKAGRLDAGASRRESSWIHRRRDPR